MKRRSAVMLALLTGLATMAAAPARAECNRTCLTHALDAYLKAMVAHDPHAAVLAPGAKHTENTSVIGFDDGLWATATGIDSYRVTVVDPRTQQIAYVGVVREHGRPVLLAARLRVPDGRVTEAETVVARDVLSFDRLQVPRQPMVSDLPVDQRVPRAQMIAGVNAYFDGIVHSDGSHIPLDPACNRLENGLKTTNNPNLGREMAQDRAKASGASAPTPLPKVVSASDDAGAQPPPAIQQDCRGQISSGVFSFISRVSPRRGFVVDEQKGLVFGLFMFNHRGLHPTIHLKNGATMPDPFGGQPWSMQMAEFFKFRNGKIWQIEAVGTPLPYGAATGWRN